MTGLSPKKSRYLPTRDSLAKNTLKTGTPQPNMNATNPIGTVTDRLSYDFDSLIHDQVSIQSKDSNGTNCDYDDSGYSKYYISNKCLDMLRLPKRSIKDQIICIMMSRYNFDLETLANVSKQQKIYASNKEFFQDCFRLFDVSYLLDNLGMYNKDLEVLPNYNTNPVVVSCFFYKYSTTNVEIHYLATRPLFDFLGYATSFLYNINNNIVSKTASNLSIAYYPDAVIGIVNPSYIEKVGLS